MTDVDLEIPEPESPVDPRIERTRAAVAAAAAELLLADGPDAITHGKVAAAANVSRTTVYKHWPERSDLLRSTIQEIDSTSLKRAALMGELRADIRGLLDALANKLNNDGHARLMAMMIERAQHDATVAKVRDALVAEIHHDFKLVIRAAVANGELRPDVDLQRAVASLAGAVIFSKFFANRVVDDRLLDDIVDDFIRTNTPA
jgi:AcrR family transcriptional regulator